MRAVIWDAHVSQSVRLHKFQAASKQFRHLLNGLNSHRKKIEASKEELQLLFPSEGAVTGGAWSISFTACETRRLQQSALTRMVFLCCSESVYVHVCVCICVYVCVSVLKGCPEHFFFLFLFFWKLRTHHRQPHLTASSIDNRQHFWPLLSSFVEENKEDQPRHSSPF